MTLLMAIAVVLVTPYLLVGGSLIYLFTSARDVDSPASRPVNDGLHAWITEPLQLGRALLAMMTAPSRLPAEAEPPKLGRPAQPVLLIHGLVCNRSVWRRWFEPLRAAGFASVRAIDLEPLFADIDSYATDVAQELRAMQLHNGGARVAIIAHSMGGIVARAALRIVGPGVISRIVTIASPHHGTAWARLLPCTLTRQMRIGSSWLDALNASQEGHCAVPLTSIYSMHDELVLPARSAVMDGARLHEMRGLGHFGVLASPECMKLALAALERG